MRATTTSREGTELALNEDPIEIQQTNAILSELAEEDTSEDEDDD